MSSEECPKGWNQDLHLHWQATKNTKVLIWAVVLKLCP
jgi:hypothetical protein